MPRGQYKRTGIKRGPYKFSEKRAKNAYEKWKIFESTNIILPEYKNISEGMFKYLYKKYRNLKMIKDQATNKTNLKTVKAIKEMTKGYLTKENMINRSNETTHEWMARLKATNLSAYNKLTDSIKWLYHEAKNEGYSPQGAKDIISDWFFGS